MKKLTQTRIFLNQGKFKVYGLMIFLMLVSAACIEQFNAEIDEEIKIFTVEGSLIRGSDSQSVVISYSTTLLYQQFLPVRGCVVKVVDELDNEFQYFEQGDGTYSASINEDLLIPGRQYKLSIKTPRGAEYESAYEILNNSPDIDSVYYKVEDKLETYTGDKMKGLQFYIDVKAADTLSRYYRWKLIDTYEYTATTGISFYYGSAAFDTGKVRDKWAVYRCWLTENVPGMYLSNTNNLQFNEKKQIPLNYVSNKTDRLKIKYSLLTEQYSITEEAYNYFQQKKIASENSGGLYTRQPSQPITNIRSISDGEEAALGYFWVSSKTEKRFTVPRLASIPVDDNLCYLRSFSFIEDQNGPFPLYIWMDEDTGAPMTANPYCFICTLRGGSTIPPDFWRQ